VADGRDEQGNVLLSRLVKVAEAYGMLSARLAASWRMRRSPPEAGEFSGVEGGDGGVPVDRGHRGAVADQQGDACVEGVEGGGAGAEGSSEVVNVHVGLRGLPR
jgi:hypothetical protein